MHKSIPLAVMALLLIASPLMMYGNSNTFILSNAFAIEDGSNTDEIKTMFEQPTTSDGFEKQALSATAKSPRNTNACHIPTERPGNANEEPK